MPNINTYYIGLLKFRKTQISKKSPQNMSLEVSYSSSFTTYQPLNMAFQIARYATSLLLISMQGGIYKIK